MHRRRSFNGRTGASFLAIPLLILVMILAACGEVVEDPAPVPHLARIVIDGEGTITLDGGPIDLVDLRGFLEEHATRGGIVWFHRENVGAEAHPAVLLVVRLVGDLGIPLSVSTRADFSDLAAGSAGVQDRRTVPNGGDPREN